MGELSPSHIHTLRKDGPPLTKAWPSDLITHRPRHGPQQHLGLDVTIIAPCGIIGHSDWHSPSGSVAFRYQHCLSSQASTWTSMVSGTSGINIDPGCSRAKDHYYFSLGLFCFYMNFNKHHCKNEMSTYTIKLYPYLLPCAKSNSK